MPRKIRELIADLERSGCRLLKGAGKGSHRKYVHHKLKGFVLISGQAGDDAQPYQEKQVTRALLQIKS
jgi:predicted RNA binding protein YcfA (HicA-like mRNA interferase family)